MSQQPALKSAHAYAALTAEEKAEICAVIGIEQPRDLFAVVPQHLQITTPLDIPQAHSEWELLRHLRDLSDQNATTHSHNSFLGGGVYAHYIPSVIDAMVSRGEFLTSYTPYQPEMSQGLLQSLFEYQELMRVITGMQVVNSSCYDGATAFADAAWMGCLITAARGTKKAPYSLLVADTILPEYRRVLETYMQGRPVQIHYIAPDAKIGAITREGLQQACEKHQPDVILLQTPNGFGVLENMADLAEIAAQFSAVSAVSYHPFLSALFETPGALGIDIVTGNGQVLGIPMRAGGSTVGIFATKKEYRKYVPGRIVGTVTDIKGNPAYALMYEDREQHIAREKATSNICSNQALNAIRAAIYLAAVGAHGLRDIALRNIENAQALQQALCDINGVTLAKSGAYFNEFTLRIEKPVSQVLTALEEQHIFGGIDRSENGENLLLIAVTEIKSQADMDAYAHAMQQVMA
jgi:glycine dehydrogenase subunit 1